MLTYIIQRGWGVLAAGVSFTDSLPISVWIFQSDKMDHKYSTSVNNLVKQASQKCFKFELIKTFRKLCQLHKNNDTSSIFRLWRSGSKIYSCIN